MDKLSPTDALEAGLQALRKTAPNLRVICLGLSALDQVWEVERLFAGGGQKIRAANFSTRGGGMAASASVCLARLGAQASFWGRGGADAAGEAMKKELARAGVDVSGFRLFESGRSSVSGVVIDGAGERQIVNFRGAFPDDAGWLPLERVADAAAVLADPRWPAGAAALFAAARKLGRPTVLDADMADSDVFEELLPLTDHVIFSEPALAQFAGDAGPRALEKVAGFGCRVSAITRGERGVLWRERGCLQERRAFAVEVVDTNGAGDAFHGAYALAAGAALAPPACMTFASAVAAIKCARRGARDGLPTLGETIDFLRNHT